MLQTNIATNDSYDTRLCHCVILTQSSVIQTIYCNVDLKCFFNFTKMCVCYIRIFH